MSGRFEAPQLLDLGPPPRLASLPVDTLIATSRAFLVTGMNAIGITYDVGELETDPAIVVDQSSVARTVLRLNAVDDAIEQSYLGSATGLMLDQRAADYGVLRRIIAVADPILGTPDVYEDDDSLRLRARLAWEAQSTAGPVGAYVFHALDAHPEVLDATVYGPESGYVAPGEVLVMVQSRGASGIPTTGQIDAVAARLDASQVTYSNGTIIQRPVRDDQSVRPLGAKVFVSAPQPHAYMISAVLYVSPGTDAVTIEAEARLRLDQYLASRRQIGREIPMSGLFAALHMVGPTGIPIIDEVNLSAPVADVIPPYNRIATVGDIDINVVTR